MTEIFTTTINFLKQTALTFNWNGVDYSFTFWQVAISLLVLELGIYIISRIVKG